MSSIARILLNNARHHANGTAVESQRGTLTWSQLAARAGALATGLLERGIHPGDRVAIVAANCPEILELVYACAGSGLIAAPAGIRSHPEELRRYFSQYIKPRVAIIGAGAESCLGSWLDDCELVVSIDPGLPGVPYADVLVEGGRLSEDMDVDAPFTIGQTSGTTGLPKGAVITQRNALSSIMSFVAENPSQTTDAHLIQFPMSAVPGSPGQLFPLPKAARTVLLPRYEPKLCMETIERYRVTHTVVAPTMLHDLLHHPDVDRYDLSSLRGVIVGAAPVPKKLLQEAVDRLGEVFVPMYGMTESTGTACVLRRPDMYPVAAQPERRLRSLGKPTAGIEVRVVDDEGADVPWDGASMGEILVRGDNVVRRYWGDLPENKDTWTGEWLRTGDVATVDADGYLYMADRKKDIIISGGTNVSSVEVEEVLRTHPAVDQVAVIGLTDERWGEAVTAVVVLKEAVSVEAKDLQDHCRQQLSGVKVPKRVIFIGALPLSDAGKILKRELRRQYAG
ncbi:MAG: hypothetical protein EPO21_02830 [Chloroflexota bacterium]|nr:MAG: hypothetical protein EPO21_02830 [Chloroflexota bacterium]